MTMVREGLPVLHHPGCCASHASFPCSVAHSCLHAYACEMHNNRQQLVMQVTALNQNLGSKKMPEKYCCADLG